MAVVVERPCRAQHGGMQWTGDVNSKQVWNSIPPDQHPNRSAPLQTLHCSTSIKRPGLPGLQTTVVKEMSGQKAHGWAIRKHGFWGRLFNSSPLLYSRKLSHHQTYNKAQSISVVLLYLLGLSLQTEELLPSDVEDYTPVSIWRHWDLVNNMCIHKNVAATSKNNHIHSHLFHKTPCLWLGPIQSP